MRKLFTLTSLLATCIAYAQFNLIPFPREISYESPITYVNPKAVAKQQVPLAADSLQEAYEISISEDSIIVRASTPQGFLWADRTLSQLKNAEGQYPKVQINDWPAFPMRGFMYDSGRNFVDVKQIEEFIDLCSEYKLNTFHWHLTDHPAWRIESRLYPQLNEPQYQRIGRDQGKYYTFDDIHHIVDYARERGVMIIPELDMPGHSAYFKPTFGFSMNSEEGMQVLTDLINEFCAEFSAEDMPYLHLGSDEIHINNPEEFMTRMLKVVEDNGRIPLAWDPGLTGNENTIYQVWRDGSAYLDDIPTDKKIVDSFMGYLNYIDPLIMTNHLFLHTPCIEGSYAPGRIGGILCLWNDVRVIDKENIGPHNGMMGGVLPFAERFWNGAGPTVPNKDVLLPDTAAEMKSLKEFQSRMQHFKENVHPDILGYWHAVDPSVEWDLTLTDTLGVPVYQGKAYGDVVDFNAIEAAYGIKDAYEAEITRIITVPADTVINCRIGFEAAPRSDRISDGIPQQGKWENYGSVTVNGAAVLPPVWKQPGLYKFHYHTWGRPEEELPYTDEQFYWLRPAVQIPLAKGDNKITLRTRKHFRDQRFQAAFLND